MGSRRRLWPFPAWLLVAAPSCFLSVPPLEGGAGGQGGSGEGGGGGASGCVPGTMVSCYDGPSETEGVGVCRAGSAECLDGTEIGSCEAQVLPSIERCETQTHAGDEDCNGAANEHCAEWAAHYGAAGDQSVHALALAQNGDLLLGGKNGGQNGTGSGTIDLGGGDITASGRRDFIARFGPDASHVWSRGLGGESSATVEGIGESDGGDVFVVGSFRTEISIGATTHVSTGSSWSIYAALVPADGGAASWIEGYGNTADQRAYHGAAGPGGVALTGHVAGNADFGPPVGVLTAVGGQDAVIAKVKEDGATLWARLVGAAGTDRGERVAVDAEGHVYVTGFFATAVDFGSCSSGDGLLSSRGDDDAFVAKLDAATGDCLWTRSFGGPADQVGRALAVDDRNNKLYLGLYFSETITDGTFAPIESLGDQDFLLAVLDADSGAVVSTHPFGGPGKQEVHDMALGEAGIALAFSLHGQVDFGGGLIDVPVPVGGLDTDDAAVVLLDPSGAHLWSRWFRGGGGDDAFEVMFGADGMLWAGGEFVGEIDFGTGLLGGGNTATDGYLVRIAP